MALQDDYIRTALRVPRGLHKSIHEAAAASTRTFNAEIVARLEASFKDAVDAKTQAVMLGEIYSLLDAQMEQLFDHQKKTLTEIAGMVQQSSPSAKAVTTGADDAKYEVAPTKTKRTQLIGNIGRLPPAEKPPAKVKTAAQRLREVATRPIRQNKGKKGL